MKITPEELVKQYQSLLKSIDYIDQASVLSMIIASTWFLWVPRFTRKLPYSGTLVFIGAVLILVFSLGIMRRLLVNPNSNFRFFLYIIILWGVIYQQILGIFVIYPILIISISAVIKSLTNQILEQIERTQHFSSSHRVSEEVLRAMQESYGYISERRNWLFNMILVLIVISIGIIVSFTVTDLITIFVSLTILQYIFSIVFLILISLLIISIFPKIDKKDQYELYIEGNL